MKSSLPIAFGAILLLGACADHPESPTGPVAPAPSLATAQSLRDRYIVVFRDDVSDPGALADALVRTSGGTVRFKYAHALKGFAATLPAQALEGIRRNPSVRYVEADGEVQAIGVESPTPSWGLDRIDAHTGLDNSYTYNADGTGVTAYIIDTGIWITHTDFGGRASVGVDEVGDGQNGIDCNGHGTHVAGTVGGTKYGVAKNVQLVAVRVLNCSGSGSYSGVIAGIDWVTSHRATLSVANMSLGGSYSQSVNDAVTNSIAAGVVYAIAAGNSNANACNYSPASTPNAITVGATDNTDSRAYYSNYGSCVDLFAPGSGITSDWNTSNTATNTISGTSMATPHVTGVAALYRSANTTASPSQVAAAITGGATTGVVLNPGTGSPNLLLYSLITGTAPPPPAPTADIKANGSDGPITVASGTSVTISWTSSNATTCSVTPGGWSGTSGSQPVTAITTSTTYTVSCTGDGGTTSDQVVVNVGNPINVHVASLTGAASLVNKKFWKATVSVLIVDASSAPVANATVSGSFSTGGSGSCLTGSNGQCSISSANLSRSVNSTTFTVSGVAGSNMIYQSGSNTASSTTVSRP